jgi:hypothetical protein
MSGLRIEIVGSDERAQRLIQKVLALKDFDIHVVPDPDPEDPLGGPRTGGSTTLRLQSVRGGRVLLHENSATGEIEGMPVVSLAMSRTAASPDVPDPEGTLLRSPPVSRREMKRPPARRWSRAPWSRRAAR